MKPKNEKPFRTLHYIFVYLVCLLLAVSVWLIVMYNDERDGGGKDETPAETLSLSAEAVCSL